MSETVDRRGFLVAGSALAGTLALQSRMYAADSNTMKVGVIGCGGRGSGAIRNVLDADKNVEIVGLCDLFENRVKGTFNNIKNRYKDRVSATPDTCFHGLDGFRKLLAMSDVNYVILATPPGYRPMHLEAAVEAGKHIFTEKPVAVDVVGTRKVLDLVKKSKDKNLKIAAGTQRRHQAGYIETIKQMHDGLVGDVVAGRVYWNGTTPWYNGPRPKGMRDAHYQFHNWYHFLWLCGDHIVEQHVHNLDVANWVMRANPVKAIGMGGRSNRPVGPAGEVGNIFDHFAIEYEYPNGVIIQSYCRQIDGCVNNVSEEFVGTKGRVRTSPGNYFFDGKEIPVGGEIDPYVQEHIDLIKAIRDDKPLNELENVANSTFTAILGRMATYSGKALRWEEVLNGSKWVEDTFPKNLTSLEQDLEADPVPIVGRWTPRVRA